MTFAPGFNVYNLGQNCSSTPSFIELKASELNLRRPTLKQSEPTLNFLSWNISGTRFWNKRSQFFKSCHYNFYLKCDIFQNSPKSCQICATLFIKFVAKNFKNSPNLVTLVESFWAFDEGLNELRGLKFCHFLADNVFAQDDIFNSYEGSGFNFINVFL